MSAEDDEQSRQLECKQIEKGTSFHHVKSLPVSFLIKTDKTIIQTVHVNQKQNASQHLLLITRGNRLYCKHTLN